MPPFHGVIGTFGIPGLSYSVISPILALAWPARELAIAAGHWSTHGELMAQSRQGGLLTAVSASDLR